MLDPEDNRSVRSERIKLALMALATIGSLLIVNLTLYLDIPHWFWRHTHTPLPLWWLIFPILAVVIGAIFLIKMTSHRPYVTLLALILIGSTVQHGFALMEVRGIDGIRDRMLKTGHALFAVEAVRQPDMFRVARQYQTMVESGELTEYPNKAKPPGQLLFYMATERFSRLLPWASDDALGRMTTFASFAWPILCYLILVPLYLLSRLFLDQKQAYAPCILYLCLPSVALITLHLDQCLYPFASCDSNCPFCLWGQVKKDRSDILRWCDDEYCRIRIIFACNPAAVHYPDSRAGGPTKDNLGTK